MAFLEAVAPNQRVKESELMAVKTEKVGNTMDKPSRAPSLRITALAGAGCFIVFPLGTYLVEEEYDFGKRE